MYNEYEYVPKFYEVYVLNISYNEVFNTEDEAWEALMEYILADYDPEIDDEPLEEMVDRLYDEWFTYHLILYHDAKMYTDWNTNV